MRSSPEPASPAGWQSLRELTHQCNRCMNQLGKQRRYLGARDLRVGNDDANGCDESGQDRPDIVAHGRSCTCSIEAAASRRLTGTGTRQGCWRRKGFGDLLAALLFFRCGKVCAPAPETGRGHCDRPSGSSHSRGRCHPVSLRGIARVMAASPSTIRSPRASPGMATVPLARSVVECPETPRR